VKGLFSKTRDSEQLVQGLANEGAHEVAHDAVSPLYHLLHPESTDLMHPHGAADPKWLKDRTLGFSKDVAAALRKKYNRPGEVDKTQCKPEEEPK
jgi:hypothetical protein